MANDVVKLLSEKNNKIADMQKNRPLVIKGHSPFKIYLKGDLKGKVLTDIHFYDPKYDRKRIASNIHIETLSIFSPYSILHKNELVPMGELKTFEIDIKNSKTMKTAEIESDLKEKVSEYMDLSPYDYFRIFEKDGYRILVPAYAIGNFFYYPNSYLKRAFFAQDISLIVQEGLTDCESGAVCFSGTHIKFTRTNAILGYLYHCDRLAGTYFYNAYSFFIKDLVKFFDENPGKLKNDFAWLNPRFAFPLAKNGAKAIDVLFRGVEIDDRTFLAFEIVDVDFKKLLGKDEITAFYESKKRAGSMVLKSFAKGKADTGSVSHTSAYNPGYESANVGLLKKMPESIDELLVKKGKAVCRGETLYSVAVKDSFEKSEGISLDNAKNPNSRYAKGHIYKLDFDFKKAMKLLETKLGLEGRTKLIDKGKYIEFLFWWGKRNFFVLELKNFDAQTLLFSSLRSLDHDRIARTIIEIKNGKTAKSYNTFGEDQYKRGVCFHIPQKHVGEDLEKWVERLIEKIRSPDNCKGAGET